MGNIKVFKKLAKELKKEFDVSAKPKAIHDFLMKYFDEVTTVYGTHEVLTAVIYELEDYYMAEC